jgi:type II secretory pathway pseudopilin PulG
VITKLWQQRRPDDGERGIALVTVIAVGAVLTILLTAAITYSVGSTKSARSTQDWNGALAAAYAGIDEYQSRLAADTTYFKFGNPAATFSATSAVTLPTGAAVNPAFGVGPAGTWATVPGSAGEAKFRYEVDTSKYYIDQTIKIRSTGLAGGETRSIVADLRQEGFISFLYFTDYEIQDPQLSGSVVADCVKYAYAGRPSTGCSEIAFGGGDTLKGPVHSNDTLRICDATFTGEVTTGYNPATGLRYSPRSSTNATCSGQVFSALYGPPKNHGVIAMPATNTQLKKETRSDLGSADVPLPGCLYTGPTEITLNSGGTMTVRSPWTKKTNVVGDPATSGSTPSACGAPGTGAGQLGSTAGASVSVPNNNIVYVQNVPSNTADPNYWASPPAGLDWSTGAFGKNGLGYPRATEVQPQAATAALPAYGYRNGDVFIKGTLKGRMTVAAENYIYATGDIKRNNVDDDMLGLVGNNAVFVWNPRNSSNDNILTDTNRTIEAAILSVAHTFQVQNYQYTGERGTLTIRGAIAQKFRGIVHSGSNGYVKAYEYDGRFKTSAPPKFLSPVTTTYGVTVWVEIKPVFNKDGSYR